MYYIDIHRLLRMLIGSKCIIFFRHINTLSINSQNDRDKSRYHKPIKQEKPTETK